MPMTILSRPVVLVCLTLPGASWAQSIPPEKSLEQILEVRRCDPNDLDSVLAATHEASWLMRFLACQMLSYRPGEKSVAALKERLGDSELRVRGAAAESLFVLGDRSGIAQLREDWRSLVTEEAERNPVRMREIKPYDLTLALETGRILARAGDGRGLPLADFAVGGEIHLRRRAVEVLTEGLLLGDAESGKWGVDCMAALERLAASEGEFLIVSAVTGCMERAPAAKAIPVLEKLSVSPRAGDLPRKAAQRLLDRKRAEARGEVPVTTRPAERRPIIINPPAR